MASTRLSKTLGTPTDNKKWTWSAWIKRSTSFNVEQRIFYAINGSNYTTLQFDDESNLIFFNEISGVGTDMLLKTTQLFRDAGAWYNIVIAYDSANSTAADRQIIYINGERVTSFVTENTATVNANTAINQAVPHTVGSSNGGGNYFNGLMTHVHFVDGTAYTATSFGSVDSTSGIWKSNTSPSVTYGNNGFFLKMKNSGAMGTDSSGKSNNFTVNGTLTQNIDTPDNNFATMNPLDNYWQGGTFSNGNNTVVTGNSGYARNSSTIGMSTGKWYSEYKVGSITGSGGIYIGITGDLATAASGNTGNSAFSYAYDSDGTKHFNGSASSFGDSYTTGDIIGVALDTTNNKLWWSKNGVWQASGDPSNNSNPAYTVVASSLTTIGAYFWSFSDNNNGEYFTCNCNFGNGYFGTTAVTTNSGNGYAGTEGKSIFNYQPPTGYSALSTKGLNL